MIEALWGFQVGWTLEYYVVTDGATSCALITTQEGCRAAARALNLADTTAYVLTGTNSYLSLIHI